LTVRPITYHVFFSLLHRPPSPTLFPYTTLFRSRRDYLQRHGEPHGEAPHQPRVRPQSSVPGARRLEDARRSRGAARRALRALVGLASTPAPAGGAGGGAAHGGAARHGGHRAAAGRLRAAAPRHGAGAASRSPLRGLGARERRARGGPRWRG